MSAGWNNRRTKIFHKFFFFESLSSLYDSHMSSSWLLVSCSRELLKDLAAGFFTDKFVFPIYGIHNPWNIIYHPLILSSQLLDCVLYQANHLLLLLLRFLWDIIVYSIINTKLQTKFYSFQLIISCSSFWLCCSIYSMISLWHPLSIKALAFEISFSSSVFV